MNTLTLKRLTNDDRPTIGVFLHEGRAICGCVEDRKREVKVKGDTRIPAGLYPLRWRQHGRWAERYMAKGFPGSLEVCDIPNFTDVLLHVGNDKGATEGCTLPNFNLYFDSRTGGKSAAATRAIYKLVHATGTDDWMLRVEEED